LSEENEKNRIRRAKYAAKKEADPASYVWVTLQVHGKWWDVIERRALAARVPMDPELYAAIQLEAAVAAGERMK
jgi:hypothetical protein